MALSLVVIVNAHTLIITHIVFTLTIQIFTLSLQVD